VAAAVVAIVSLRSNVGVTLELRDPVSVIEWICPCPFLLTSASSRLSFVCFDASGRRTRLLFPPPPSSSPLCASAMSVVLSPLPLNVFSRDRVFMSLFLLFALKGLYRSCGDFRCIRRWRFAAYICVGVSRAYHHRSDCFLPPSPAVIRPASSTHLFVYSFIRWLARFGSCWCGSPPSMTAPRRLPSLLLSLPGTRVVLCLKGFACASTSWCGVDSNYSPLHTSPSTMTCSLTGHITRP
jgi:hypothetical protein